MFNAQFPITNFRLGLKAPHSPGIFNAEIAEDAKSRASLSRRTLYYLGNRDWGMGNSGRLIVVAEIALPLAFFAFWREIERGRGGVGWKLDIGH